MEIQNPNIDIRIYIITVIGIAKHLWPGPEDYVIDAGINSVA
jgi:hypothetical protein